MEESQESPHDLSTTKKKHKKTKYGRYTNDITKDEIEANYDKTSEEAAVALGVGTTILKRLCRKFGIQRWPYRQTNGQIRPKKLYDSHFNQGNGQESPSEALKDPPAVPPSLANALPPALAPALPSAPPAAHGNLDSVDERRNQLPTTSQTPVALQVSTTNSQELKTTRDPHARLEEKNLQETKPTPALGNEFPPSWQPAAIKIAPPPVVIVTGGAGEVKPPNIPDNNPGNTSLPQVLADTISSRFPAPNTTTTTTKKNESFAPPPPISVSNHHPNGLFIQNAASQSIINGSKTIYSGQAPAPPPHHFSAQDADVLQELAMQPTLALHQRGFPTAGVSPSISVPVTYPPMRPPPPPKRLVQPPPPPPPTELEMENELILELASYHVDDEDVVKSLLSRAVIEMHARLVQTQAVDVAQAQSNMGQHLFGVGAPRVAQHVERARNFSFEPPRIAPRMQESGYQSWLQGQGQGLPGI